MRIIAGKRKGLHLKAPKGHNTRPTADRVKEALFNIIQGLEVDALVLDLFAGTGALGIEALSRGAKKAVFVERDPLARKVLSENIARASMEHEAVIIKQDALSFLNSYHDAPFDLIFLDPPYDNEITFKVLNTIVKKNILSLQGMIIWEKSGKDNSFQPIAGLKLVKEKQYGDTMLLFLELIKGEKGNGCI